MVVTQLQRFFIWPGGYQYTTNTTQTLTHHYLHYHSWFKCEVNWFKASNLTKNF